MSGYLLTVAGAVLLSAAIAVLLPQGKMGDFLKGMCRLFLLAVLIAPLVSLFTEGKFTFAADEIGSDDGYLAACAKLLSEEDESRAEAILKEEFGITAEVCAEREEAAGFPLRKIVIKGCLDGIIGQDEHINMAERIEAVLKERLCAAEAEIVWDG